MTAMAGQCSRNAFSGHADNVLTSAQSLAACLCTLPSTVCRRWIPFTSARAGVDQWFAGSFVARRAVSPASLCIGVGSGAATRAWLPRPTEQPCSTSAQGAPLNMLWPSCSVGPLDSLAILSSECGPYARISGLQCWSRGSGAHAKQKHRHPWLVCWQRNAIHSASRFRRVPRLQMLCSRLGTRWQATCMRAGLSAVLHSWHGYLKNGLLCGSGRRVIQGLPL